MTDRDDLRGIAWKAMPWCPTYWLIDRRTGLRSFHLGDDFDAERYSVGKAEDHAHCVGCHATFSADPSHQSSGYYNDEAGWLCASCYDALGQEPSE